MNRKLYKVAALLVFAAVTKSVYAQVPPEPPVAQPAPVAPVSPKATVHVYTIPHLDSLKDITIRLKDIDVEIQKKLSGLNDKLAKIDFHKLDLAMADFGKNLSEHFKDFGKNFEGMGQPDPQTPYKAIEKTRVISKTYAVDRNDKLSIDNQFGTVVITTWAKNEIKVDVEIKAYENSEAATQELLDNVTITDSKQPNLISFKTDIKRSGSQSWFTIRRNGQEERRGVQVNYVVYMPSKNPLDITNKLGSIRLPDFDGSLNINSVNGSLKAGKLTNIANRLIISQGSADIEAMSSGNINASQSSVKIANADKVTAKISTSSTKIGTITNGGNFDIDMGSCKIDALSKNMKDIVINADKSTLAIVMDPSANFDFDVTINMGGFSYNKSKVNLIGTQPDADTKGWMAVKNYKGQYGKGSDSKIIIKSSYGTVRFQ